MLLFLAELTVGLNINGPHWNVRLLGAKIRSPQMAYIFNQGTGKEELGEDQKIYNLQKQVGALTQKVETLENEFQERNDEVQAMKKEHQVLHQATKNELRKINDEVLKINDEVQAIKKELQATKKELQATKNELKNELQEGMAEFRARLMKVEKLLGLRQKETYF